MEKLPGYKINFYSDKTVALVSVTYCTSALRSAGNGRMLPRIQTRGGDDGGGFARPRGDSAKVRTIEIEVSLSAQEKSVVPLTVGSRRRDHDETSLVLLFYDDDDTQGRR